MAKTNTNTNDKTLHKFHMTTTATPPRQAAVGTPPRQDRRVTFLDYNSDEEEERSNKGFEDRIKRKEYKRLLAEKDEEPSDSKLKNASCS